VIIQVNNTPDIKEYTKRNEFKPKSVNKGVRTGLDDKAIWIPTKVVDEAKRLRRVPFISNINLYYKLLIENDEY
jgi:hypothetical protein